jgi:hypothetical protein
MARTIIVGDVHGCSHELSLLLGTVGWTRRDRVFFVGDLFSKGPDPGGVLELLRTTRGQAVRGNHENALLVWKDSQTKGGKEKRIGQSHRRVADLLGDKEWKLLRDLPLFLDLPEHGVRIVHAGVIPGIPIEDQPLEALVKMRYVGDDGTPIEKDGHTRWTARYTGPPHIVFGHDALLALQIHRWATGLDTGAVYGGQLTAMVLDKGQAVPPAASRTSVLFSVPALRRYCQIKGLPR